MFLHFFFNEPGDQMFLDVTLDVNIDARSIHLTLDVIQLLIPYRCIRPMVSESRFLFHVLKKYHMLSLYINGSLLWYLHGATQELSSTFWEEASKTSSQVLCQPGTFGNRTKM